MALFGNLTAPQDTESVHLAGVLLNLYAEQLSSIGQDPYLIQHANPDFVAGQLKVFEWYRNFLPESGTLLDWGCRHAPDSCLIRSVFHSRFEQHACDLPPEGQYRVFHNYARIKYQHLTDVVKLPYDSEQFDTVIGSGVLEHVAMDYESLKELYRVLKVEGRLIITYLPNRQSWGEWRLRRTKRLAHRRLYGLRLIQELMLRTGFYPTQFGYQCKLDQLHTANMLERILRPAARFMQLQRVLSSCICIVAKKVNCM